MSTPVEVVAMPHVTPHAAIPAEPALPHTFPVEPTPGRTPAPTPEVVPPAEEHTTSPANHVPTFTHAILLQGDAGTELETPAPSSSHDGVWITLFVVVIAVFGFAALVTMRKKSS